MQYLQLQVSVWRNLVFFVATCKRFLKVNIYRYRLVIAYDTTVG
jgi:hypothetical protein